MSYVPEKDPGRVSINTDDQSTALKARALLVSQFKEVTINEGSFRNAHRMAGRPSDIALTSLHPDTKCTARFEFRRELDVQRLKQIFTDMVTYLNREGYPALSVANTDYDYFHGFIWVDPIPENKG